MWAEAGSCGKYKMSWLCWEVKKSPLGRVVRGRLDVNEASDLLLREANP